MIAFQLNCDDDNSFFTDITQIPQQRPPIFRSMILVRYGDGGDGAPDDINAPFLF